MGKLDFFEKIGLRHFLSCMVLHLHAKNQEILMSQSREKLITNERTNGRTDGRTNERTDGQGLIYSPYPHKFGRSKNLEHSPLRAYNGLAIKNDPLVKHLFLKNY